ncbi:membrane protein [Levilactobacillus brevis]|nr:membrane protein [Levilactobacillus brevis]
MTLVNAPITWLTCLTFVGTTLGVLCVLAINAAKSVNGWLGVISAICFVVTGLAAKNYLSIFEQIAYVITLDIPVLLSASWNVNMAAKIRRFTGRSWVIAVSATLIIYLVSGWAIGTFTDDPRPWVDAISFAISLTAGVICFLRFNNQYVWWIASGLAQMVLWFISFRQGSATLAMFINSSIYLMNDVLAFTISPWYNAKERQRLIKQEAIYATEVAHAH